MRCCVVKEEIHKHDNAVAESNAALALADATESRKVVMQMAEESATDRSHIKINPSVALEAGMSYDERYLPSVKTPNKTFFNSSPKTSSTGMIEKDYTANKPPTLTLGTTGAEIKRRTGFVSKASILSYIIIV